jgi:hypothetical protein
MRCLTPNEADAILGATGFRVSTEHAWYRKALILKGDPADRQSRIGGRPTLDISRLANFAEAINRWLPTNRHRLLWVDHSNSDYPSVYDIFVSARAGLGDARSLSEAPGHYFDSHHYDQQDQTEISPEQAREVGIMVGLMSLIMIGGWDAWLVADNCADRVEFWEGNIFFHSGESSTVARAELLLNDFDCPRELQ